MHKTSWMNLTDNGLSKEARHETAFSVSPWRSSSRTGKADRHPKKIQAVVSSEGGKTDRWGALEWWKGGSCGQIHLLKWQSWYVHFNVCKVDLKNWTKIIIWFSVMVQFLHFHFAPNEPALPQTCSASSSLSAILSLITSPELRSDPTGWWPGNSGHTQEHGVRRRGRHYTC